MTDKTYRFELEIIDNDTGETIVKDWTLFCADQIGPYGCVETVDIHTGSMLRYLRSQVNREALALLKD